MVSDTTIRSVGEHDLSFNGTGIAEHNMINSPIARKTSPAKVLSAIKRAATSRPLFAISLVLLLFPSIPSWVQAGTIGRLGSLELEMSKRLLQQAVLDWPQWRGPARSGHVPPGSPVPSALPKEPKNLWRIKIGEGHSSPVVAAGKVVYTDARGSQEVVHVLDAATGRELWSQPYDETIQDEWGTGPRATPLVDGDRLYVQSCQGEFRCVNLSDGKMLWGFSFEKDYGVKFVGSKAGEGTATRRGNNGNGVIDENRIIVPVGNTNGASLVCFDKQSGAVLWKTGNDEAAYSSFMIATLAGVKQIVAFTAEALTGLDRRDGRTLWRVPLKTNAKRHAATPVILGDHVIVNSHTFGMVCVRITKEENGLKASQAWLNKDMKINVATSVAVGHYLFSHGPSKNFVCIDADTGKLLWEQSGFGKEYSSTMALGQNLLVLTDDGELLLIAADRARYHELGRAQVCGKTWGFPAYVGGKLFVRDSRELTCFDLMGAN
jgi:outer membrane protein assembly factor BamB